LSSAWLRQQRANRRGGIGGKTLRRQPVQSVCDLMRSRRRRVECQPQHRGDECAHSRGQRATSVRVGKTGAEQSEISERVLQQRVVALELFGQLLLPGGGGRKSIDRRCLLCISLGIVAQSTERITQGIDLSHQWIIVAQHANPRAEDVPVQRNLHHRETVERFERAIVPFLLRIDRAERQPG
jgi:hypothetical protein